MDIKFKQWAKGTAKILLNKGITTDNVINAGQESNNSSTRVDHMTDNCLGRITVWKSGDINMEVLDVETSDTILFENYTMEEHAKFETYLEEYFRVLVEGNKK